MVRPDAGVGYDTVPAGIDSEGGERLCKRCSDRRRPVLASDLLPLRLMLIASAGFSAVTLIGLVRYVG
ncbi:hypothetical protein NOR53_2896 [gamma proteobacterium NOR5-3]|nr:hypothetical protein NOR53_2896 [gamma proteobacterium NOR5-3]